MSLEGLRMTGFKYESRDGFDFDTFMEGLVGKSGEIIHDWDNAVVVSFSGNIIAKYPKPEALKYVFKVSNDYIDTMDWDKVKEDAKKEKMEKQIFKVGDRVYHISYGWGVVKSVDHGGFPILVSFVVEGYDDYIISFSNDGFETSEDKTPLLSFTEYTLQGFSQERPIELPEVGELCLVRNEDNEEWILGKFDSCVYDGEYLYRVKYFNFILRQKQMKRIKILD